MTSVNLPMPAAGIGAGWANVPQLRLGHHDREHRQRPVGGGGFVAHGIEPAMHVCGIDVQHAHLPEKRQDAVGNGVAVGFARGGFPAALRASQELLGIIPHQRAGVGFVLGLLELGERPGSGSATGKGDELRAY